MYFLKITWFSTFLPSRPPCKEIFQGHHTRLSDLRKAKVIQNSFCHCTANIWEWSNPRKRMRFLLCLCIAPFHKGAAPFYSTILFRVYSLGPSLKHLTTKPHPLKQLTSWSLFPELTLVDRTNKISKNKYAFIFFVSLNRFIIFYFHFNIIPIVNDYYMWQSSSSFKNVIEP